MNSNQASTIIGSLLEDRAKEIFVAKTADTEETLGIVISQFLDYDGLAILKTAYNALEDANFHAINLRIKAIIDELEGKICVYEDLDHGDLQGAAEHNDFRHFT